MAPVSPADPAAGSLPSMPPLVDTAWLASQLGASDLVVFDASWYLPGEQRDARAEFARERIPGARFFDVDLIADPDSTLPHMVPGAARFEALLGALGVGNASRLVFYDQKGLFSAARGWWLMRLFGHEASAVLDGGLPKWRAEGRAVERGVPAAIRGVSFRARLNTRYWRGIGDVWANLETQRELLLDARSAERFEARAAEPRPGVRAGHVPGSRNLPYTRLLTAQQTLLSAAQLRSVFAGCGADGTRTVVTSCGSGLSAAILNLALEVAGLPRGALYDGSWAEWGGRSDTPVESGRAPGGS